MQRLATTALITLLSGCWWLERGTEVDAGLDASLGFTTDASIAFDQGAPDACGAGCGAASGAFVDVGVLTFEDGGVNLCDGATVDQLPLASGLLRGRSSRECPLAPPTGACSVPSDATCSYGSARPGCYNHDFRCIAGQWLEQLHTDPTLPWNLRSCVPVVPAASGCPTWEQAFGVYDGETCALRAETTCDYLGSGECTGYSMKLRCDGTHWHRLPQQPYAYCACTAIDARAP